MSKSAERAMVLLKVLARNESGMGLMELANTSSLDKSTTARLLNSLQKQGFVHRDQQSKRYHVGAALLALAATTTKRNSVLRLAHPFLERLRDLSGETSSFYLRIGDGRVCVDGVESRHGSVRLLPLGEAAPLILGTSSKVILAFQSDDEIKAILDRLRVVGGERERLLAIVDVARRQGYYASTGERMKGVATVSAPVRAASGVVAAITLSGPEDRWTADAMDQFAPTLIEVAVDLSALMQHADLSVYGVG